MKKTVLLNSRISAVIADMGHTDMLVIADAGLPVPSGVEKIDLAVTNGLPGFFDVLEAVLCELCVERATIAAEMEAANPEAFRRLMDRLDGVKINVLTHESFKELTNGVRAVVRTGECRPYANVILHSGVVF